ncbi:MAG: LysE family translocator [Anaerolineae bacterium]
MLSMWSLIAQAIGFGFNAGILPGPLQSFLISMTLTQGWRRGIIVMFSPFITDIPVILTVVFILGRLPDNVIRVIQVVGGTYLLWLAFSGYRAYRAGDMRLTAESVSQAPTVTPGWVLRRAVTINALSHGPYIFWGAITGPLLIEALDQSLLHAAAFMIAFYGTFLSVMLVLVIVFNRLRYLDPRLTNGILLGALVLMAVLGVQLIVQGALG